MLNPGHNVLLGFHTSLTARRGRTLKYLGLPTGLLAITWDMCHLDMVPLFPLSDCFERLRAPLLPLTWGMEGFQRGNPGREARWCPACGQVGGLPSFNNVPGTAQGTSVHKTKLPAIKEVPC